MTESERCARPGDTLTLHYRLSADDGSEIDSTFGNEPATIKLGTNELAENLERCLIGLTTGQRWVFRLEPWQAFGTSDPALIQEIALEDLHSNVPLKENSLIEFSLPNGSTLAGTIKSKTQTYATVDFNHPLSNCAIVFEVEILSIAS
jgi:FKBP-type peptidyl-prolyl cis-trans isomerase SlpA